MQLYYIKVGGNFEINLFPSVTVLIYLGHLKPFCIHHFVCPFWSNKTMNS